MTRYKMINNKRVAYTAEEEKARDAKETAWEKGALDRELNWLRTVRNNILKETDYMGNSDVTMSDAWKTYRQQMRDITTGLDTVAKVQEKMKFDEKTGTHVNFPTKPS
tara:strand:- start:690 stop:1013 length:324 start_codon:yes stop_codon:yes gene_type:complete